MMTDYDLSAEQVDALLKMTDYPRPLAQLIVDKPPFATRVLRACDYARFLQEGWITDGATVALTPLGLQVQSALKPRKAAFTQDRFAAGDQVTITAIAPIVGRNSRVLHWDAKAEGYRLKLYPEDFNALTTAGYTVPDFESRVPLVVAWEVLVSREQDARTGWRCAGVVAR